MLHFITVIFHKVIAITASGIIAVGLVSVPKIPNEPLVIKPKTASQSAVPGRHDLRDFINGESRVPLLPAPAPAIRAPAKAPVATTPKANPVPTPEVSIIPTPTPAPTRTAKECEPTVEAALKGGISTVGAMQVLFSCMNPSYVPSYTPPLNQPVYAPSQFSASEKYQREQLDKQLCEKAGGTYSTTLGCY